MAFEPVKGSCVLIPVAGVNHLFVVLNDPDKDGLCLLAMVSSIKPKRSHDPACQLDVGEHEFIRHPSFIVYRIVEQSRAAHIEKMVDKGYYLQRADADAAMMAKVCNGFYVSEEIRPSWIKYGKKVGI